MSGRASGPLGTLYCSALACVPRGLTAEGREPSHFLSSSSILLGLSLASSVFVPCCQLQGLRGKMPFQAAAASTAMVPQAHPLFWEAGGEGEQWPTHDAARHERITRGVESDRELTNPSANWQLLGTWAQSHSEGSPDPYERPVRWQALLPGKENLKHDRTQGGQVLHRQGLHLVCRLCSRLHSRSMILKGIEKVWHR